ncbi:MAG: hypothetical protein Q9227_001424 [Pyrenula ochraceoflavens]
MQSTLALLIAVIATLSLSLALPAPGHHSNFHLAAAPGPAAMNPRGIDYLDPHAEVEKRAPSWEKRGEGEGLIGQEEKRGDGDMWGAAEMLQPRAVEEEFPHLKGK